ncbi:MAG: hypothetical protein QOE41_4409 [Mycobacterium sp.]|nr:hypothetical protein [Mycobacterium sp.]
MCVHKTSFHTRYLPLSNGRHHAARPRLSGQAPSSQSVPDSTSSRSLHVDSETLGLHCRPPDPRDLANSRQPKPKARAWRCLTQRPRLSVRSGSTRSPMTSEAVDRMYSTVH